MAEPKYCPMRDLIAAVRRQDGVHPRDPKCIGPECAWWRSVTLRAELRDGWDQAAHCGLIPRVAGRNDWKDVE